MKKSVHNPALCLAREHALKEILRRHPEAKKYFKLASKKQIKQWEQECEDLEPYGA